MRQPAPGQNPSLLVVFATTTVTSDSVDSGNPFKKKMPLAVRSSLLARKYQTYRSAAAHH